MAHRAILQDSQLRYYCPGCGHCHAVNAVRWHFNGNLERPTLSPSVRHYSGSNPVTSTTCHYHIVNGQIKFCEDSPHAFAGKTVDLREVRPDGTLEDA